MSERSQTKTLPSLFVKTATTQGLYSNTKDLPPVKKLTHEDHGTLEEAVDKDLAVWLLIYLPKRDDSSDNKLGANYGHLSKLN